MENNAVSRSVQLSCFTQDQRGQQQVEARGTDSSDGTLPAQELKGRQKASHLGAPDPLQHLGPQSSALSMARSDGQEEEQGKVHVGARGPERPPPPFLRGCRTQAPTDEGASLAW